MMHNALRLASLLLAVSATPLAALEGGGLLSIDTGLMVWTVAIFVIVLAILYKAAYPQILGAVEAREERLRELLASAASDREEAHALLEQQRAEMEKVRQHAQEAFAESRAAAERVREEMLAETRAEQDEMLRRAQREIEQQARRAMDQLRREAVEIALAAASRLVERDLDGEQNRRLVRDYLAELERADADAAPVPAGV
jgi:F-type H+-transporting ATPase subunit b